MVEVHLAIGGQDSIPKRKKCAAWAARFFKWNTPSVGISHSKSACHIHSKMVFKLKIVLRRSGLAYSPALGEDLLVAGLRSGDFWRCFLEMEMMNVI